MNHDAFYALTPKEFYELVEGYNWRVQDREEREAGWVVLLANAAGRLKHPLRVTQVLGRVAGRSKHMVEREQRRRRLIASSIEEQKRADRRRFIRTSEH